LIPEEFSIGQAQFLASVFQAEQMNHTEIMPFSEREVHMDADHRDQYEEVLAKCCYVDKDENLRIQKQYIIPAYFEEEVS
jgi:hypothetical protein